MYEDIITTSLLGTTIVSEPIFEHPDGTPLLLDEDYFGEKWDPARPVAGPINYLGRGNNRLKIR